MGKKYRETGLDRPARTSSSLNLVTVCDGLAERGRRRAERPLSGWIRVGLESYIDSDK